MYVTALCVRSMAPSTTCAPAGRAPSRACMLRGKPKPRVSLSAAARCPSRTPRAPLYRAPPRGAVPPSPSPLPRRSAAAGRACRGALQASAVNNKHISGARRAEAARRRPPPRSASFAARGRGRRRTRISALYGPLRVGCPPTCMAGERVAHAQTICTDEQAVQATTWPKQASRKRSSSLAGSLEVGGARACVRGAQGRAHPTLRPLDQRERLVRSPTESERSRQQEMRRDGSSLTRSRQEERF